MPWLRKKQKEVGLLFRNLDNFGVTYKSGSEKALWRYNALMISGSSQKDEAEAYTDSIKITGAPHLKDSHRVAIIFIETSDRVDT